MSVRDLRLRNNGCQVLLAYCSDSIVENVSVNESITGITLDRCEHSVVKNNSASSSVSAGILAFEALYLTITQNTIEHTTNGCGIWIEDSNFLTVKNNTVTYAWAGGPQEYDGCGILVDDSSDCNVTENTLMHNLFGITFGGDTMRNRIACNAIMMNTVGFIVCGRSNIVYHNNVVANDVGGKRVLFLWSNEFDIGVYGGNFWSDYNGTDSNRDGIGDTPYIIDSLNIDHYPLMNVWRVSDVNCDGDTNVLDLIKVAHALGSHPGGQKWNPNADTNEDGNVDVLDLIRIATHLE
jgi:parallel beta-helix repeat protein